MSARLAAVLWLAASALRASEHSDLHDGVSAAQPYVREMIRERLCRERPVVPARAPEPAPQQDPSQGVPQFRAGTDSVRIYATVTRDRALVTDVAERELEVRDDGRRAPITLFSQEIVPLRVAVVLDASGSMQYLMWKARDGASSFIRSLLPDDEAAIVSFADHAVVWAKLGCAPAGLLAALDDMGAGGQTRLYDGLLEGLEQLAGADEGARRVLLVLSDGEDRGSKASRGEVAERVRALGVQVYAIGLRSRYHNGRKVVETRPDESLGRLADDTGGSYVELPFDTSSFEPAFRRVAEELRHQYLIAVESARDGRLHKLELRVSRPGLAVRARKTYLAQRD